jgi:hypothetical protein
MICHMGVAYHIFRLGGTVASLIEPHGVPLTGYTIHLLEDQSGTENDAHSH